MSQNSVSKKELINSQEQLLHPISMEAPSGENLRYDPIYDQIKKARLHDNPNEPRGVWDRELKKADWVYVRQLCEDALITRSKDLQLIGWLIEAYIHLFDIDGLEQGLQILYSINKANWDTIYPLPENGDWEYRTRVYDWINQKIPYSLQTVELTNANLEGKKEIKLIDLLRLHKRTSALQSQIPPEFSERIEATDSSFFNESLRQLERCKEILSDLELFLQTNLRSTSIYFYAISGSITTLIDWNRECLEYKTSHKSKEKKENPLDLKQEHEIQEPRILMDVTKFTSREEAYNALGKIIKYLSSTEPSSPIPYILYKGYELRNSNLGEIMKIFSESGLDAFKLMEFFGMEKAISSSGTDKQDSIKMDEKKE